MPRVASLLALALGLSLLSPLAQAATVSFDTSSDQVLAGMENQGWWDGRGTHNPANDNYFTGKLAGVEYRSFFSFNLTGLAGKVITGLELQLRRYDQSGTGTVTFHDVSTPTSVLYTTGPNLGVFDDLGSGNSYGSAVLDAGARTDVLGFVLNAQAVADANAALSGFFSIGATFSGDGYFGARSGYELSGTIFGNTQSVQRLVVTYEDAPPPPPAIPLPASLPLLAAGLAGLVALRRKKA